MTFREFAGIALWTASAIGVAGYTWDAYTQTYSEFPTAKSSGGSNDLVSRLWSTNRTVDQRNADIGAPNLARNKNPVLDVAGAAASPITPGSVIGGIGSLVKKVTDLIP